MEKLYGEKDMPAIKVADPDPVQLDSPNALPPVRIPHQMFFMNPLRVLLSGGLITWKTDGSGSATDVTCPMADGCLQRRCGCYDCGNPVK